MDGWMGHKGLMGGWMGQRIDGWMGAGGRICGRVDGSQRMDGDIDEVCMHASTHERRHAPPRHAAQPSPTRTCSAMMSSLVRLWSRRA